MLQYFEVTGTKKGSCVFIRLWNATEIRIVLKLHSQML